ncbi:MAG: hypothetical protein ACRD6N_11790 [Pyrinomonadaceae bacterium]
MSKLIALAFDDPYKADEARAALHRMEGEGLLDMDETAVIVKKVDEKVRITQDVNVALHGPVLNLRQAGRNCGNKVPAANLVQIESALKAPSISPVPPLPSSNLVQIANRASREI